MALAIFDLDNTLIDRAVPFRMWASDLVTRHGLDPIEVAWLEAADGDGYVPRSTFLTQVQARYGLTGPLPGFLEQFRDFIVEHSVAEPGVAPMLDRLRADGWTVAIATNGTVGQQARKIERSGLVGHVDAVAISEEVGCAKPDRRMFEAAAQRAGARLSDGGWMIGDCPLRDIGGGRAVGLRTVWVRRGRTWDAELRSPDAVVNSVEEVDLGPG